MIMPNEDMIVAAEGIKQMFDAYMRAGFTEQQAIKLCVEIIKGK